MFCSWRASVNGKANVHIMIEEGLSKAKGFSAGAWIKELSPIIKGGGGGQPFYASAGGNDPSAIKMFIEKAVKNIGCMLQHRAHCFSLFAIYL